MRFYDWRRVQTLVNGVPVTGWAPGDDVYKAERLKESVVYEVGADGEMTVSLVADKSGKITIKLMQTSPLNNLLMKICAAEDQLATFIPVVVSQLDTYRADSTQTVFGFIEKPSDQGRGAKAATQDWVFIFPRIQFVMGAPTFAGMPTELAEGLG
jgi:hypothetical protein